jgi:hypothetical protein
MLALTTSLLKPRELGQYFKKIHKKIILVFFQYLELQLTRKMYSYIYIYIYIYI